MTPPERQLEEQLIEKLRSLKYEYRTDIRDRATLEKNFRDKFEALNRVRLTEGEFPRLLEEIITPDVFAAARTLRERNSFTRDDGTPLNYTLVNITSRFCAILDLHPPSKEDRHAPYAFCSRRLRPLARCLHRTCARDRSRPRACAIQERHPCRSHQDVQRR